MPHTDYSTRTYEPTPYQMERMRKKIAKKASLIDTVARGFFIGLLEAHPNLSTEAVIQMIQDTLNSMSNEVLSFHEPAQNEIYAGEIYDGEPVTEEEEPQEQQVQEEELYDGTLTSEEEFQEQQVQEEEELYNGTSASEDQQQPPEGEVIIISDDDDEYAIDSESEEEEVVTSEEGDFDDQPGTPGAGMTLEGLETFLAGHVGQDDYPEHEETYSPPSTPGGDGYYDSPPSTPGGEGYQESTHRSHHLSPFPYTSENEQDPSSSEDEPGPSPRARFYHSDSYLSRYW